MVTLSHPFIFFVQPEGVALVRGVHNYSDGGQR